MSGVVLSSARRRSYRDAMARVKQLERALAPFALEAAEWSDLVPDRYRPGVIEPRAHQAHARARFNLGHLRRAEKLLRDLDR